jgi:elongation factor 1-alpha
LASQKNSLFDSGSEVPPRKISEGVSLSKFELYDKIKFDIEYDYGNIEYKLKLCGLNNERIEELVTQMKFRLDEGNGECFYEIGVEDNGNPLGISMEELEMSVEALQKIVSKLDATANVVKLHKGNVGLIAEVFIKKKEEVFRDKLEIKIGLLGDGSSGKSTLVKY